jgi:hypothetical protein
MVDYLSQVTQLEEFDFSGLEFNNNPQILEQIFKAIFQNKQLTRFNLFSNDLPLEKHLEGFILRTIAPKIQADIKKWSLKNCELGDDGIRSLLKALDSSMIEEIDLSLNLKLPKSPQDIKDRECTILALADYLITHPVRRFRCTGIRATHKPTTEAIGPPLSLLFPRLASADNLSLVLLDLSGNNSGDEGALALSKFLQKNSTITSLYFDKNSTGLKGFNWIKQGVRNNYTLMNFEALVADIFNISHEMEIRARAIVIWREIEELLYKRKEKKKKKKKKLIII